MQSLKNLGAQLEAVVTHDPAVVERIRKLQWLQLQHDREYHADIFCLTPAEKLTHFVLHLNKYAPKLMRMQGDAMVDNNVALDYINILTDFGVILLSMANVFQIRLGEYTADRLDTQFERLGSGPISYAFYNQKFGGATPSGATLLDATVGLLTGAGEAADVMIKHAKLEGNIRSSMTNLIYAMWESYHIAFHTMAYEHDILRPQHFDTLIRDRIIFIETKNSNYLSRPKYAEDFAPVA